MSILCQQTSFKPIVPLVTRSLQPTVRFTMLALIAIPVLHSFDKFDNLYFPIDPLSIKKLCHK